MKNKKICIICFDFCRSRKRRPSSGNDWSDRLSQMENRGDFMDECSAAMVLMSLSTPPKNGFLPMHCQSYGNFFKFFCQGKEGKFLGRIYCENSR